MIRQLKITKSITNRESQSLEKYLQEIGKVDLLTPEEEADLAKRTKLGDREARDKLAKANLRFVVSVAKQYQNQGLSLNDLINEGNLGLIKAAQRFDETRGFRFISYAVWWIRQSILQALVEQSRIVKLPANKVGSLNKISKVFAQLEQEFEREPTPVELAEILNTKPEEIEKILGMGKRQVSLDEHTNINDPEDGDTLLNTLANTESPPPDENLYHHVSLTQEVRNSLSVLGKKQQKIVRLYFGIGCKSLKFEEIGGRLGFSRERARQLFEKAIKKLRARRAKVLRCYLGN